MIDAILEAAARALQNGTDYVIGDENASKWSHVILAAVTPLIEATALERAAKEFEEKLRAVAAERDELKERLDDIEQRSLERKW